MMKAVKKLLGKIRQSAQERRIKKFRKRMAEAYPGGEAFIGAIRKGEPYSGKDLFLANVHLFVEGELGSKGAGTYYDTLREVANQAFRRR